MRVLVTGSSGLVGSEAVLHFERLGHTVVGVDNNLRRVFFGPAGDTNWNLQNLKKKTRRFHHLDLDIRERSRVIKLFEDEIFDAVIHCAAQPSHDKAKEIPFLDFDVNAVGTLNLLEATRRCFPEAPFIFMSTNKVYGDAPNETPLVELETRWEYKNPEDYKGVSENCRIDRTTHSLFGASKTSADVVAQEYGRYFNMNVGVFRGGCITGENHSGVQLHGFLSFLIKTARARETFKIFGYKGKQVRDQIHASDLVSAFEWFIKNPKQGEVYNIGGGRENSVSVLEAISKVETALGYKMNYEYVEQPRVGDHICYISDLTKFRTHYPFWRIEKSLDSIITTMVNKHRSGN